MFQWIETRREGSSGFPCNAAEQPPVTTVANTGDGTFVNLRSSTIGCTDIIWSVPLIEGDNQETFRTEAFTQIYAWEREPLPCGEYRLEVLHTLLGDVQLLSLPTTNNMWTSASGKEVFADFRIHSFRQVRQGPHVIASGMDMILERTSTPMTNSTFSIQNLFAFPSTVSFQYDGGSPLIVNVTIIVTLRTKGMTNTSRCGAVANPNGRFRIGTQNLSL